MPCGIICRRSAAEARTLVEYDLFLCQARRVNVRSFAIVLFDWDDKSFVDICHTQDDGERGLNHNRLWEWTRHLNEMTSRFFIMRVVRRTNWEWAWPFPHVGNGGICIMGMKSGSTWNKRIKSDKSFTRVCQVRNENEAGLDLERTYRMWNQS